ncbi:MAG: choice-of-anchor L domain-containing protein [Saprospiraceae bacterium]
MKIGIAFLFFSILIVGVQAQLVINPLPNTIDRRAFIQNHFADSNMVILSASIWASPIGVGSFEGAADVIGIEEGILICTGNTGDVIGPPSQNISTDLDFSDFISLIQEYNNFQGDEDLQIMEVDFISLGDSIAFNFVFASEHYDGLECGADYDWLEARLVKLETATGIAPVNMLTVPGKDHIGINANTINNGLDELQNDDSAFCVELDVDWRANSQFFAGNHPSLAFNGFTKVLSSKKTAVIPNERYRLYITIAEGVNGLNDSGLFLEKGSFSSNSEQLAQYEVISFNTTLCDTLTIGELVITEEGSYFGKISAIGSVIDTFAYFGVYREKEEVLLNHTICPGDTLYLPDTILFTPTVYLEYGKTTLGCDSITTHKIVWDTEFIYTFYNTYQKCFGDTIIIADTFFVESTLFIEEVGTDGLCDSIFYHDILFSSDIILHENLRACVGDTIHLFDSLFVTDGIILDTIQGLEGCDTIIHYEIEFEQFTFEVTNDYSNSYCQGDTIDLKFGRDFTAINKADAHSSVDQGPMPLFDGTLIALESSIFIDAFETGARVTDVGGIVEVCLTIEHSWMLDLGIFLQSPSGQRLILHEQYYEIREVKLGEPVDGDDDFPTPGIGYTYCWSFNGTNNWREYITMFSPDVLPSGLYKPFEPFDKMNIALANGEWKLLIYDTWEVDNGFLFDWSISFGNSPSSTIQEQGWLNQEGLIFKDSLSLQAVLAPGSYDFTYFVNNERGCYGDTTFTIDVFDLPNAPTVLDTVVCGPIVIFDHLIESSGKYSLEVGLPYFCEVGIIEVTVEIVETPIIVAGFFGSNDTYHFVVNNFSNSDFYLDFGDGDTSHMYNVTHVYDAPGEYLFCYVAQNSCDSTKTCERINVPNWYTINGKIETSPLANVSSGISAVTIAVTSGQIDNRKETNESGIYQFDKQWESVDYSIIPSKEDHYLNGLDIGDLILLARFLNGVKELDAPYQLLAADLDCNQAIDHNDQQVLQTLLLQPGRTFPENCSNWIFWPQSYTFPTPAAPFDHPTSIRIDSLVADAPNNDFYGLKRGDLGGNASAARDISSPDTLFFLLENGSAAAGDTIQFDFRVRNFEALVGFQLELNFDTTALQWEGIELGEVPGMSLENFGLSAIEEGQLRIIWLDILGNAHSLADATLAFRLRLVAKQAITDRMTVLAINDRDLAAKAFDADLLEAPVVLKVDPLSRLNPIQIQPFILFQNRPNPFNAETIIPFELPQSEQVTLLIYNQLGQEVWRKTSRYPAGRSEEKVQLDAQGVYYYALVTPWGKATKKMVMVN